MADLVASFIDRSGVPRGHCLLPDQPTVIRFAVEYGLCPQVPGIHVFGGGVTLLRILDGRLLEPRLAAGPIMLATTIYRRESFPGGDVLAMARHSRELIARIRRLRSESSAPVSPADYDHQLNYLDRRLLALAAAYDLDPSRQGHLSAFDLHARPTTTAPTGYSWTHLSTTS
jgi:hypothetical protein